MDVVKDKNSILEDLVLRSKDLTEKVSELRKAEDELSQINAAIKALGGQPYSKSIDAIMNFVEKVSISTLTWPEKIKYVVGILGEASVQDIINRITQLDSKLTKDAIHNTVTSIASSLAVKGELIAKKDGIKNIYSIPK